MLEVEEVRGLLERLYNKFLDYAEWSDQEIAELLDEVEDYLGIEHGIRE